MIPWTLKQITFDLGSKIKIKFKTTYWDEQLCYRLFVQPNYSARATCQEAMLKPFEWQELIKTLLFFVDNFWTYFDHHNLIEFHLALNMKMDWSRRIQEICTLKAFQIEFTTKISRLNGLLKKVSHLPEFP